MMLVPSFFKGKEKANLILSNVMGVDKLTLTLILEKEDSTVLHLGSRPEHSHNLILCVLLLVVSHSIGYPF